MEGREPMKKYMSFAYVLVLTGCLFAHPLISYAAEEGKLSPAQQQEIEAAKLKTRQELKHPSKQLEPSKVRELAQKKGVSYDALLRPAKIGTTAGSVGTKGDILVTLSSASSGSSAWVGGHAGIVSDTAGYVVESFGNKGNLNGVRHWKNDWVNRYEHIRGLWVDGADSTDYSNAASYARQRIGLPYNYNFFDVKNVSKFYCSQLVWRTWYQVMGVDLNDGGAVWPVDLIESPKTIIFYSKK
jgi:uncharacterized protein YycO